MTRRRKKSLSFLLISERTDTPWTAALQKATSTLGELHAIPEKDAVAASVEREWDLVMVDAGAVQDSALLVTRLRENRPDLRIVVFTSSPTWRRTREVLQAGALDYIRKSLDEEELRIYIRSLLRFPRPRA